MPFEPVRDSDSGRAPRLPEALVRWRDEAPKRRVVVERARVGNALTATLYRGASRAHFPSVRSAIDAVSTPERRAKITWLRDRRGDDER